MQQVPRPIVAGRPFRKSLPPPLRRRRPSAGRSYEKVRGEGKEGKQEEGAADEAGLLTRREMDEEQERSPIKDLKRRAMPAVACGTLRLGARGWGGEGGALRRAIAVTLCREV